MHFDNLNLVGDSVQIQNMRDQMEIVIDVVLVKKEILLQKILIEMQQNV
jgi:hypothetical protein